MQETKPEYKETVIYIRTSTEEQNPKNQWKDCERIRPKDPDKGTPIDYSLFEERQSAWKEHKRPLFDQILKLIKARKVRDLIVWDLDRLYRNRKKLVGFFELCKIYGCNIHSFRQKWLEDIYGMPPPFNEIVHTLMLQIMGWLAEDESNRRSDRIKAAVRKGYGITKSYKGNKWGRKTISTFKRNRIRVLHNEGRHTMRGIASEVNISLGVVHKTIANLNAQKENGAEVRDSGK